MSLSADEISAAAVSLVCARRDAKPLNGFPADVLQTLEDAYAIQMEAVRRWGGRIAGWKVGRLTGAWEKRFGINRFIGPIFADTIQFAESGVTLPFPAIEGGSAAIESEIVARLNQKVEPALHGWTAQEAKGVVGALHIGIEVAGCAVPGIGNLGPLASIAAFGNNMGLIVGAQIADCPAPGADHLICKTQIEGVGEFEGSTAGLPGGLFEAIAFALSTASRLDITLSAGSWISTGAITGVHGVSIGQKTHSLFEGHDVLSCQVVAARPG